MRFMKWHLYLMISLLFTLPYAAHSKNESKHPSLHRIEARRDDNKFLSDLIFNRALKEIPYEIKYLNRSIQVDFPKLHLSSQKLHYPIKDDPKVSSIYTYQLKDGTLRFRINLSADLAAEQYRDLVQITNHEKAIRIVLEEPETSPFSPPIALSGDSPPNGNSSPNDDSPPNDDAPPNKVDQELQSTFQEALVESQQDFSRKPETEVPLHLNKKSKSATTTPSLQNLAFATIGLVVLMVALLLIFRWWTTHNRQSNKNTRIKILAQHYIRPKQSLALIRVAGESILIGVTDHNISLIKPLSLLDEEIPEISSTSFSKSLESSERDNVDDFAIKEIKDLVTTKLKGLRQI